MKSISLMPPLRPCTSPLKNSTPLLHLFFVDGNRFKPYLEIPHKCMIKGDARFLNIAAASVLAKTERDEFMTQLHSSCPHYHWDTNKGYPTKKHRKGIQSNGASKWHRKSFTLLPTQNPIRFLTLLPLYHALCTLFHCDFFLDTMFNAYAASG